MKITILCDNITSSPSLGAEHGLSVYIESEGMTLLFDTGASPLFSKNAEKLGIDISAVDIAVVSHGHYDHGGGLPTFLKLNKCAKIYMSGRAFGDYYADSGEHYIGLDKTLRGERRIEYVDSVKTVNAYLTLFSNVCGNSPRPALNKRLLKKEGLCCIEDDFAHEVNAVINFDNKTLLLAGCAHNGILNILNRYEELFQSEPDYILGGLHLCDKCGSESEKKISSLANRLKAYKAKIFTCHCTGLCPYGILKEILGDKIEYAAVGCSYEI